MADDDVKKLAESVYAADDLVHRLEAEVKDVEAHYNKKWKDQGIYEKGANPERDADIELTKSTKDALVKANADLSTERTKTRGVEGFDAAYEEVRAEKEAEKAAATAATPPAPAEPDGPAELSPEMKKRGLAMFEDMQSIDEALAENQKMEEQLKQGFDEKWKEPKDLTPEQQEELDKDFDSVNAQAEPLKTERKKLKGRKSTNQQQLDDNPDLKKAYEYAKDTHEYAQEIVDRDKDIEDRADKLKKDADFLKAQENAPDEIAALTEKNEKLMAEVRNKPKGEELISTEDKERLAEVRDNETKIKDLEAVLAKKGPSEDELGDALMALNDKKATRQKLQDEMDKDPDLKAAYDKINEKETRERARKEELEKAGAADREKDGKEEGVGSRAAPDGASGKHADQKQKDLDQINSKRTKDTEFIAVDMVEKDGKTIVTYADPKHMDDPKHDISYVYDNKTGKLESVNSGQEATATIPKQGMNETTRIERGEEKGATKHEYKVQKEATPHERTDAQKSYGQESETKFQDTKRTRSQTETPEQKTTKEKETRPRGVSEPVAREARAAAKPAEAVKGGAEVSAAQTGRLSAEVGGNAAEKGTSREK